MPGAFSYAKTMCRGGMSVREYAGIMIFGASNQSHDGCFITYIKTMMHYIDHVMDDYNGS